MDAGAQKEIGYNLEDDMDRYEFVSTLRASLMGKVPDPVVEDNVRYYEGYISQEIAGGKSEREVLDALGDPRLIAKTIVDMQGDPAEEVYTEYRQESASRSQYGQESGNPWYSRVLMIVLLILILTAVFSFLSWILPVVLPVLLILWIIRLISKGR